MLQPPPRSTLFPYTTLFRSTISSWCRASPGDISSTSLTSRSVRLGPDPFACQPIWKGRSEEHTSELQSRLHLVCRLLLEKKKNKKKKKYITDTNIETYTYRQ